MERPFDRLTKAVATLFTRRRGEASPNPSPQPALEMAGVDALMAPQRFDGWARTLGVSIARRGMLKGVGTAIMVERTGQGRPWHTFLTAAASDPLAAASSLTCKQLAPAPKPPPFDNSVPPATFTSISQNQVTGDCNAAVARIAQGTSVPGETPIPNSNGLTIADFGGEFQAQLSDPKKKGSQYCVTSTSIRATFSVITTSYHIEWTAKCPPCQSIEATCPGEKARWERQTALHEGWHVLDAKTIVDATNSYWQAHATDHNFQVTSCTPASEGPQAAIDKAQQDILARVDAQAACITTTFMQHGQTFDQAQQKTDIGLQCALCECVTPQSGSQLFATTSTGLVPCGAVCCDTSQPGQMCCNDQCVNLFIDATNCGACGHICASNETCVNGVCTSCVQTCAPNETCCNGHCVNLQSDFNNCGGCGHACASSLDTCCGGTCCPYPQICCGSVCCGMSAAAQPIACCPQPSGGLICSPLQTSACP
jgi:hypothetical protein